MATFTRKNPNCQLHNWLIYDCYERILRSPHITTCLSGTIYDLGCGEMPYKDWFLTHADQYTGVDWGGTLHQLKADIVADLNEPLPIESEVADTVVSLSVLEHLCKPQTMLNEAFRILKPRGGLVLQVPWQWWIHEAPHDYYRYTPYGLRYLLERAGFSDIHVEPQAGFFTTMTLKLNYFSLRLIRGPRPLRLILRGIFSVVWYVGQRAAPILDRLDRNWALETSGYFITARKPDVVQS